MRVSDPVTGEQLAKLTGHRGGVTALAVLPGPDGAHRIVSGGRDRTVLIWAPASESPAPSG